MRLSLKQQIILSSTLIIFTLGAIATFTVYYSIRDTLIDLAHEDLVLFSEDKADDVLIELDTIEKTVDLISHNPLVLEALEEAEDETVKKDALLSHLSFFAEEDFYAALYVMDSEGNTVVSTDERFVSNNYSFRDYFSRAISGVPYLDISLGVTSGELGYYFSHPVLSGNVSVGVFVAKIRPDVIHKHLSNISDHTSNADAMLVDDDGVIFYSTDWEDLYKTLGAVDVDSIRENTEKRYPTVEIENKQYDDIQNDLASLSVLTVYELYDEEDAEYEIISVVPIVGTPFFLVVEEKLTAFIASAERISLLLALAVLFAALFAWASISIISSHYLEPISSLRKSIQKVGAGDYSKTLSIKTHSSDLSDLVTAFNEMIVNVRKSRATIQTKVEEQTAEILEKGEELEEQRRAIMNVLDDVNEEKLEVERQSLRNELVLTAMEDGMFVLDTKGRVEFMNNAAHNILLFEKGTVEGKTILELTKAKIGNKRVKKISEMPALICMKKLKVEKAPKNFAFQRGDGEYVIVDLVASPLVIEGQVEGAIVVFRDVTKERIVDRMKSDFVSVASHQLRTPLSAIRWYGEMLLGGDAGKLTDEQKEHVKQMHESSLRMISLVNALLNVSRIESGRIQVSPEPTDLGKLLNETIKVFEQKIQEKDIKLTTDVGKGLSKISADPKLLREVFANLISNAVKYTPDSGNISVSISVDGDDVVAEVKDTGYGIPKAQHDKVFARFFRADNIATKETDGTGLGLYIVKAIVESSGGKIWFTSEEDKGTTFTFTLPVRGVQKKVGDRSIISSFDVGGNEV